MKRIIAFFFGILLVFMCSAPAYAAGGSFHIEEELAEGETVVMDGDITVEVRVDHSTGLPEFPLSGGSGGGTLPDGTEISVTGAPAGATYLVVRQISQMLTEPYKWFKDVLGNKSMQAYEIFFRDDLGNRIAANGATIKVSTPSGMTEIVVYSVDPDESNAKLTVNIKDGKAIFRTDGKRYYVLTGTISGTTPDPDVPKPDDPNDPPKTGDESNMMLWIILLIVAFVGMVLCVVLGKRRKKDSAEKK